jgi:hypothetical protein
MRRLDKKYSAASRCWRHENDEQCTTSSRACGRAAATLVRGGTLTLCRTQSVRSDAWRNQGVCGMDNDGKGCQGLYAELFALCRYYSWRQSDSPAGYAATCNQAQRDSELRLPLHWIVKCGNYQYSLLLKDNLSGYLLLVPFRTAEAAATVDALRRWFAVIGVVLIWISDRDSHFKNEVVRRAQKEFKAKHNFTTDNCPWSNGAIGSA